MFNFPKNCLTSYMKINIVGKQKNLTLEIFLYVLEKIFIVNLKKKNLIFGDTLFYEFEGQSKGHKVKYLKITCS